MTATTTMVDNGESLHLRGGQRSFPLIVALILALVVTLAACSSDDGDDAAATGDTVDLSGDEADDTDDSDSDGAATDDTDDGTTDDSADAEAAAEETEDTPEAVEVTGSVRLITHDSFLVTEGLFDNFTLETGYEVEVVSGGDAGELVSRAILTAGQPEADVLFGVDNTFLQRALDAEIFESYASAGLATIPSELQLDPENRVTPIDFGDVCVNYWTDALDGPAPAGLDDLTDPSYASSFVTEDPETSSPGFAFLLATIATYGEDGWQDYWQQLTDGGVTVEPGWSEAYYGQFVAGGGDKAIVTSYATSPVAEVIFAEVDYEEPPTGVLTDSCFRQIEFAGILAGTENRDGAEKLVDFMTATLFQEDMPLNMFVYPANSEAAIPSSFEQWATVVDSPLTLEPAEIEANRSRWTQEWAEIVLR